MKLYLVSMFALLVMMFSNVMAAERKVISVTNTKVYNDGAVEISTAPVDEAKPSEVMIRPISKQEIAEIARTVAAEVVQTMPKQKASVEMAQPAPVLVVQSRPAKRRFDHLRIGMGIRALERASSPEFSWYGFHTRNINKSDVTLEPSIEGKLGWAAIELIPSKVTRYLDIDYTGYPTGTLEVVTSNAIIFKAYPVDNDEWSASVGIGAEFTKLKWSEINKAYQWWMTPELTFEKTSLITPVVQITGNLHVTERLSIGISYILSDIKVKVEDVAQCYSSRVTAQATFGIF